MPVVERYFDKAGKPRQKQGAKRNHAKCDITFHGGKFRVPAFEAQYKAAAGGS